MDESRKVNKLEHLALDNMVHSSEAMVDRRRRILREARKIISRDGFDGFSMRDLGKRANVSTRTIYNAFGSKETVVALSIHAYFESFVTHLGFADPADSFTGALTRQITSTLRDIDIPQYMQAVVRLYFSPTLHSDIREVLLDLASRSWVAWLRSVKERNLLEEGVDLDNFLMDLCNLQYARIHEWCMGALADEPFLLKSLTGILVLLAGATRGAARTSAKQALQDLHSNPGFRKKLFSDARNRIIAMETSLQIMGR